jgi:lipopolysaccharide/colanic/teichoic acid biosynthesis glycosyltransferase
MTRADRIFDLGLGMVLAALIGLPFLLVLAAHALVMGRPVLHPSERMRSPAQAFVLWKLRSMHPAGDDAGVSGGHKAARVPGWGRFLRATRLDEVPQLWNVLRGDMRLVGPRPPLRAYVDRYPELYAKVLQTPPGITGLATLVFHRHERSLLSACLTATETDAVYSRRCIPRKARMDLVYHQHRGCRLDVLIMFWTLWALTRRRRQRLVRRRGRIGQSRVSSLFPGIFPVRFRHPDRQCPSPSARGEYQGSD